MNSCCERCSSLAHLAYLKLRIMEFVFSVIFLEFSKFFYFSGSLPWQDRQAVPITYWYLDVFGIMALGMFLGNVDSFPSGAAKSVAFTLSFSLLGLLFEGDPDASTGLQARLESAPYVFFLTSMKALTLHGFVGKWKRRLLDARCPECSAASLGTSGSRPENTGDSFGRRERGPSSAAVAGGDGDAPEKS